MNSSLGDWDLHLWNEGSHSHAYDKLGAHSARVEGKEGVHFAVWAPNAKRVGVLGDWNHWTNPDWLVSRQNSGIWEGFVPSIGPGAAYKYHVESNLAGYQVNKADPFAFYAEEPPKTASIVWQSSYRWQDEHWMEHRGEVQGSGVPLSIYEVHLGSWMRVPEDGNRSLSYREIAPKLVEHVLRTGFTHVELMPVMEHPFYGSWGYQVTGYFAPTSRYGTADDFKFLVDTLHRHGIGVILDWVPAHFPMDEHALVYFDGTHLFEHADPRQGVHADWGSAVYNYERREVQSFLLSSANFWVDEYHVDGLRVDAVASMLYLDYGRKEGEWLPNQHGGKENLGAIELLRRVNTELQRQHPGVLIVAEESTAWPGVTRPVSVGGLGFSMKWDMGWMHDTLDYLSKDPVHRSHHHHQITFRGMYAFSENFVLALSHDEVVHGKGSLLNKMPGDEWQKFANLRLLYGSMWSQPGKKLLFMGGEFGQWREWAHDGSLDWHLLDGESRHAGLQLLVGELNRLYREVPALHQGDFHAEGFQWVDANDWRNSVIAYLRKGLDARPVLVIVNATPVVRSNYRVGVDHDVHWDEILNTDAVAFGGSGQGNSGGVSANPVPCHGRPFSLNLTLPPLGVLMLRPS